MKPRAKQIWNAMTGDQKRKALSYYCNLAEQVHHNCEHGHRDFTVTTKQTRNEDTVHAIRSADVRYQTTREDYLELLESR